MDGFQPGLLTEREIEILGLIADGLSNQEIAEKLFLTLGTVKWYNTQIYGKLGVKNRTQAIARTRELELTPLETRQPAPTPAADARRRTLSLPALPLSFIGREDELARLADLLAAPDCRLLTLVGPGGIGKTSLAIEAAERQTAHFPDGVYFVSLSPLSAPEDILTALTAVANAVNFRFKEGENPKQQLLASFRDRRLLLVLDNFDELLSGADQLAELLHAAPGLKVLTTSRERLNLQEEVVFRVEGMPLPQQTAPDAVRQNAAVRLFIQGAHHARPDFTFDDENLLHVLRICRLVEGMPLGIVLAAAWVEMLSPAEIADEISKNLDFLETRLRNMPERHRSLRAVFRSSWNLLAEPTRRAFARLSVFRGGFTREAAQQIAGADLHTLMALVNKSLLRRALDGRYETHEMLRQYAAEQLRQSGEEDAVCQAHSRYYLELLGQLTPNTLPSLDRIEADFENIRAAWNRAVESGAFDLIERALPNLYSFCARRSRYQDAASLFDRVLDMAESSAIAARPLLLRLRECRGKVRGLMGEFNGAVADLSYVRDAAHEAGDLAWERELLVNLGQLYRKAERHDEAAHHLGKVLHFAQSSGNLRAAADTLYHLGTVAWDEGDNTQAAMYHQEAADICRRLGLQDIVAVQAAHGLGETTLMSGQPQRALELFEESLALSRLVGDSAYEAENLQMIGWACAGAVGTADYPRALECFTRALEMSEAAHLDWHTVCSQIGLGLAQGAVGEFEAGFKHVHLGLHTAESLGVIRFVCMALDCLGQLYQDLNLLPQAETIHMRGVELMLRHESTYWLSRLQANLAIDRMRQGNLDVERDLLSALEVAQARGQEMHATRCLEGLAELHIAQQQPDAALDYANRLLALADAGGLRESAAQARRWRGEAFLMAGKPAEAEVELKQAGRLAGEIGRVRLIWDVHAALSRLYLTQGHDEAAQTHQAAAREMVERIARRLPHADLRAELPR